jgi:hypothetical protein
MPTRFEPPGRGAAVTIVADPDGVSPLSFKELLESWRETAAEPRTATRYEVRLPLDDAARLNALIEMFPGRTAEQLITDLLGIALAEVGTAMPYVPGKRVISMDEQGDPVYEDAGLTPRFVDLTRRNRKKLEAELQQGK